MKKRVNKRCQQTNGRDEREWRVGRRKETRVTRTGVVERRRTGLRVGSKVGGITGGSEFD